MTQNAGTVELPSKSRLLAPGAIATTARDALTTETPLRARELVVLAVTLVVLALVAYGGHVEHGGFMTDDWSLWTSWLIKTHGGHVSNVWSFVTQFTNRPALGIYLAAVEAVLGFHQGMQLALALLMAITLSISIYMLLRTLGIAPIHSGIIAALSLVFPGSDSLRLWSIAGDASWALSLLLLGAVLTLRSFNVDGRRQVALRVAGLALYALSLSTYEIGMLTLAVSFVLYRCRVSWRRALRAWALDLPVIVLVYVLATRHTSSQHVTIGQTVRHGLEIARDALKLFGKSVLPFGGSGWVALAAAVVVIAAAAFTARQLPIEDSTRRQLRQWLGLVVVGSVLTAASYAIYSGGLEAFYMPLSPGEGNRVNALAGPLLIAIAYAVGALLGLLLLRRVRGGRRYLAAFAAGFGVLLGGFYLVRTHEDATLWTRGYQRGEQVLALMKSILPKPPPGSLIVSFGQPVDEAPGIPVWATYWDLSSAVKLRYDDFRVTAMPGILGTKIDCGKNSAIPVNQLVPGFFTARYRRPYGRLYLFATNRHWIAPRSQGECRYAAPTYWPGPWFVSLTAPS